MKYHWRPHDCEQFRRSLDAPDDKAGLRRDARQLERITSIASSSQQVPQLVERDRSPEVLHDHCEAAESALRGVSLPNVW